MPSYNPKAVVFHKHQIKEKDVPKMGYRNGFAGHELLKRHHDLNFLVFYFVTVLSILLKIFFSKGLRRATNVYSLRGWLGMQM